MVAAADHDPMDPLFAVSDHRRRRRIRRDDLDA